MYYMCYNREIPTSINVKYENKYGTFMRMDTHYQQWSTGGQQEVNRRSPASLSNGSILQIKCTSRGFIHFSRIKVDIKIQNVWMDMYSTFLWYWNSWSLSNTIVINDFYKLQLWHETECLPQSWFTGCKDAWHVVL